MKARRGTILISTLFLTLIHSVCGGWKPSLSILPKYFRSALTLVGFKRSHNLLEQNSGRIKPQQAFVRNNNFSCNDSLIPTTFPPQGIIADELNVTEQLVIKNSRAFQETECSQTNQVISSTIPLCNDTIEYLDNRESANVLTQDSNLTATLSKNNISSSTPTWNDLSLAMQSVVRRITYNLWTDPNNHDTDASYSRNETSNSTRESYLNTKSLSTRPDNASIELEYPFDSGYVDSLLPNSSSGFQTSGKTSSVLKYVKGFFRDFWETDNVTAELNQTSTELSRDILLNNASFFNTSQSTLEGGNISLDGIEQNDNYMKRNTSKPSLFSFVTTAISFQGINSNIIYGNRTSDSLENNVTVGQVSKDEIVVGDDERDSSPSSKNGFFRLFRHIFPVFNKNQSITSNVGVNEYMNLTLPQRNLYQSFLSAIGIKRALSFMQRERSSHIPIDDAISVHEINKKDSRLINSSHPESDTHGVNFDHLSARVMSLALRCAKSINNEAEASLFMKRIGVNPLIAAASSNLDDKIRALQGLHGIMSFDCSMASSVATADMLNSLIDSIEAPFKGFSAFKSSIEKEKQLRAQLEAVALVNQMARSSSIALEAVCKDVRFKRVLNSLVVRGEAVPSGVLGNASSTPNKISKHGKKKLIETDLRSLKLHEMARIASWTVGGLSWKPRQTGQRGLRILSFDGGGTRGVLSLALLRELMIRVGKNSAPFESFDIICGTSTGGIIATLLGMMRIPVNESEALYDTLINKVFSHKSSFKLVRTQALYNEVEFEKILEHLCGDDLLIDSNRYEVPRVFMVSSKVNVNPSQIHLWRNYNYPPEQKSKFNGSSMVTTRLAVRATTAAPTYFPPVQYDGGLYCDGAIVANNPTAIAVQEAKLLFPNVPIEFVVSIGTGIVSKSSSPQRFGWDALVSQIISSSTDTEDIHSLLGSFLPPERYFRLNPTLIDYVTIDDTNKTALANLKQLAEITWRDIDVGPDAKRYEQLIRALRGN